MQAVHVGVSTSGHQEELANQDHCYSDWIIDMHEHHTSLKRAGLDINANHQL